MLIHGGTRFLNGLGAPFGGNWGSFNWGAILIQRRGMLIPKRGLNPGWMHQISSPPRLLPPTRLDPVLPPTSLLTAPVLPPCRRTA